MNLKHFTIAGDPHARPENLIEMNRLFDLVEELGNDVVWLGDMLDTKELVRGKALNFWYERFKGSKLKHHVLIGNHDWFNHECKEHSLRPLKELPNVRMYDEVWFQGVYTNDRVLAFIPYHHDPDKFKKAFENALTQKPSVIFIHQGIQGFDYGNGRLADGSSGGELKLSDLKGAPLVISGHFHKYQAFENLIFLGTPMSKDFGESNQEKYLGILSIPAEGRVTAENLELIPTPFPRHVTVNIDVDTWDDRDYDQLADELSPENPTRFILSGSSDGLKAFPRDAFPWAKIIENPVAEASKTKIQESDSNEVKFSRWAKEVAELDPVTTELGLEILREVTR